MKFAIVIDATKNYLESRYEFLLKPLYKNLTTPEILFSKLKKLNLPVFLLYCNEEKNILEIAKKYEVKPVKSKKQVSNHAQLLKELYEIADELKIENLILCYIDAPLLDMKETEKLIKLHSENQAEYSFGENFAEGLVPEIMSIEFLKNIKEFPYKKPDVVSRRVFDNMQADINKFFIEVEISDVDFSLKRLSFTANSKRNFILLKNLFKYIEPDSDYIKIYNTIENHPEILHIFPRYIEIEITNRCNFNCSFCPRQIMKRKEKDMDISLFSRILNMLTEEFNDIIISFTLLGEPLLHPQFKEFVETSMNSNIFSLIVETNGSLLTEEISKFLSQFPPDKLLIIFGLDAFKPETYRLLKNQEKDIFEKVRNNIIKFLALKPENRLRTFVQIVKMNENKFEIEDFYNFWKQYVGENIIIQKYNSYVKKLPDRDPVDITPLERIPCWHLQRDLIILSDGKVPLCKQDINCEILLGDLNKEDLKTIWERQEKFFIKEYKKDFSQLPFCKECDEWYTFNF